MKKVLAILRGLAMYAVFLLLPAGLWICAQLFLPASWLGGVFVFLENFSTILTALLLLGLYALRGRGLRASAGFAPREAPLSRHIAAFALGVLGNGAVSFLLNLLPASWLAGYAEQSAAAYDPNQSVLSIIAIVLLAPVGEELIFRGMIYRPFGRRCRSGSRGRRRPFCSERRTCTRSGSATPLRWASALPS